MGCREWCSCCEQPVTPTVLKKHADEAARQRHIAGMGGDLPPATTLKVTPITGNETFGSHTRVSGPTVTIDEDTSQPDFFTPVSPTLVASLPHSLPLHFVEDDDFSPDPVKHIHDPPQVSEPADCYPSMEMSDADTDDDEDKAKGKGVQDEPDLEAFMDEGYLRQVNSCLCIPYCTRSQ